MSQRWWKSVAAAAAMTTLMTPGAEAVNATPDGRFVQRACGVYLKLSRTPGVTPTSSEEGRLAGWCEGFMEALSAHNRVRLERGDGPYYCPNENAALLDEIRAAIDWVSRSRSRRSVDAHSTAIQALSERFPCAKG